MYEEIIQMMKLIWLCLMSSFVELGQDMCYECLVNVCHLFVFPWAWALFKANVNL